MLSLSPEEGGKIAAVTGFLTADLLGSEDAGGWITGAELFARFGVPADPPYGSAAASSGWGLAARRRMAAGGFDGRLVVGWRLGAVVSAGLDWPQAR